VHQILCFIDEDGFVPVDEKNLLYVAATRAKKALLMSRTLVNVLKKAGVDTVCLSVSVYLSICGCLGTIPSSGSTA
jgi:hypothetical protein